MTILDIELFYIQIYRHRLLILKQVAKLVAIVYKLVTIHCSCDQARTPPVTEIAQNHKSYDVPCPRNSCLENVKYAS